MQLYFSFSMAHYATKLSVAILLIGIITFSMFVMSSSGARILSDEHAPTATSTVTSVMRKLGSDETMLGYYLSKARSMMEGKTDRMVPGGPDPRHH
ncbi:hypothetical protein CASFOL_019903 [Castilleja foliolosa]|uniref:Uncharacterized protein n=1 Tax=Castilleja foliolosa TaxID=1961234 RepID=A0ABD3D1B9_9LAMI